MSSASIGGLADSSASAPTLRQRGQLADVEPWKSRGTQIALYAAIAAFAGGVIFLVLSILGFLHMRRTPAEAELQPVAA